MTLSIKCLSMYVVNVSSQCSAYISFKKTSLLAKVSRPPVCYSHTVLPRTITQINVWNGIQKHRFQKLKNANICWLQILQPLIVCCITNAPCCASNSTSSYISLSTFIFDSSLLTIPVSRRLRQRWSDGGVQFHIIESLESHFFKKIPYTAIPTTFLLAWREIYLLP